MPYGCELTTYLCPFSSLLNLIDNTRTSFLSQCPKSNHFHFGLVTFHDHSHLFQTQSFRLGIYEQDGRRFDGQPDHIDDVIVPLDILQADRVDELVEGTTSPREELGDGDTFAAVDEWKHFGDEDVGEWHHEVVKAVVDEDESDDRFGGGLVGVVFRVHRRSAGPAREQYRHADVRGQVLASARESVGEKGTGHSRDEVPTRKTQVDLILGPSGCDADRRQHFGEIVRDQSVAGPLREQAHTRCDKDTSAVDAAGDELLPWRLGALQFHADGFTDLLEFSGYE